MNKKFLYLCLFFFIIFCSTFVYADTIYTKNGKVINCKIVDETTDTIWYEILGGRAGINKDSVLKIEKNEDGVSVKTTYGDHSTYTEKRPISEEKKKEFDDYREKMKQESANKGLLKIVDDPSTAEALNKFQERMAEIGKDCPQPQGEDLAEIMAAASKCVCSHLEETQKAIQGKLDAFRDLVRRRPDLMNEIINIKGAFGNFMINQEELNKENSIDSIKKDNNCE